jgi:hypothetical protein
MPQELRWEELRSVVPGQTIPVAVYRASVPGGWFVWIAREKAGVLFYPDPLHQWGATAHGVTIENQPDGAPW